MSRDWSTTTTTTTTSSTTTTTTTTTTATAYERNFHYEGEVVFMKGTCIYKGNLYLWICIYEGNLMEFVFVKCIYI